MSLVVDGLDAGYPGRPVLRDVRLPELPAGTVAAVVGPNAVGKSTLLQALAGLRPASGRVVLDGADLAGLPARERLQRVGYLPQALPPGSSLVAYETWQAALRAGRPTWSAADRDAAIDGVVVSLGLQAIALRRLDELSGGQRQMVGLAQVVVRAPRLLLLDEPTSALDLRWQLQVLEAVRALAAAGGTTALVATHDLNLALRFCHRVVVLGGGRVLAAGEPSNVLSPALLREAYGVTARVERCSLGHLLVLADASAPPAVPARAPLSVATATRP